MSLLTRKSKSYLASYRGREGGLALISVLWVLVVLSVIFASIFSVVRGDYALKANQLKATQMKYAADGAVQKLIFDMLAASPDARDGFFVKEHKATINDQIVNLRLEKEVGKININLASSELLEAFFQANNVSDIKARSIAESIVDWRDPDIVAHPYGGEAPLYASLGNKSLPRNSTFRSLDELLLVNGFEVGLFNCVAKDLTLYTETPVSNLASASETVKKAYSNFEEKLLEQSGSALAPSLFEPSTPSLNEPFNIWAKISFIGEFEYTVKYVVRLTGSTVDPFWVYSIEQNPRYLLNECK